jgi:hypothetical protein
MITVSPYIATVATQVHTTRSRHRIAAARKSAKNSTSGGPRYAAAPPGTRNAIATAV